MSDKAFFDTNVLVYAFDKSEQKKSAISKNLIHNFGGDGNLVLSTQVLQEFYVTLTRVGKDMQDGLVIGSLVIRNPFPG